MASTNDVYPLKQSSEVITPHKITVSVLIRSFCILRDSDDFRTLTDESLKAKYRRDFGILILRLLQSPGLRLQELRNALLCKEHQISTELIQIFDDAMLAIYQNGIGSLLDLISVELNRLMSVENCLQTLVPNRTSFLISRNSVVGHYLRRLIVHFEKLTFSEAVTVYHSFRRYFDDWKSNVNTPQIANNNNNSVETVETVDWYTNKEQWNRRQAELFIARQMTLLNNNEEKALPPGELKKRISDLLKSNPSLAEAHFVLYLNYLRVKEFCGAVNSLYHCFDRSANVDNSKNPNGDKSKVYRFALLNFAILHFQFGHQELAMTALKEAIKISQAANDNVCLQHALSWYCRLNNGGNKGKLMSHLISKCLDLNMSYTMSLGIQTFVQYTCAMAGNPVQIFETLSKSDMINYQHNMKELISNSFAVNSCLWQFYGKPEVSSLWSQLLFYQNMDSSCPDSAYYYGEGFCLAICNVANYLLAQGDYQLVVVMLAFAKRTFPHEPHARNWMLAENLFVFVRATLHQRWSVADSAARKIAIFDELEGLLRLAELSLYRGEYGGAHQLVRSVIAHCEQRSVANAKPLRYYLVRAKCLSVEVQVACASPDRIPMGVITELTQCLTDTVKYHMDYQSSLIQLHVAHVLLLLGTAGQALQVLNTCLVQILAHGGLYDRARAKLLHVKCLLANVARADKKTQVLKRCATMLDEVREQFLKIEAYYRVKDVLFLQAHLYSALNMTSERNRCSYEFRLLDEEHTTRNHQTLIKLL